MLLFLINLIPTPKEKEPVLTGTTGEAVTLQSYTQGSNGVVTIGVNLGELVYTPNEDFVGIDRYVYVVEDKFGNKASATVEIIVVSAGESINIPSIGQEGSSFAVLAENDNRLITGVTASAGYVEIDTGDISRHTLYIDPDGYIGTMSISYVLSDGSTKTIFIDVHNIK